MYVGEAVAFEEVSDREIGPSKVISDEINSIRRLQMLLDPLQIRFQRLFQLFGDFGPVSFDDLLVDPPRLHIGHHIVGDIHESVRLRHLPVVLSNKI
ncbi:hypothetical protein L596_006934 [Steinernema carpocapsae]|uniref:Uncharacterized protein n=1 Tax=Steinernema carpocapsae TaxID=34508 RepID=A0A4U5P8F0_STECR|nr:hypothetical protein L596_006934 [Steinernema carpocapsae]